MLSNCLQLNIAMKMKINFPNITSLSSLEICLDKVYLMVIILTCSLFRPNQPTAEAVVQSPGDIVITEPLYTGIVPQPTRVMDPITEIMTTVVHHQEADINRNSKAWNKLSTSNSSEFPSISAGITDKDHLLQTSFHMTNKPDELTASPSLSGIVDMVDGMNWVKTNIKSREISPSKVSFATTMGATPVVLNNTDGIVYQTQPIYPNSTVTMVTTQNLSSYMTTRNSPSNTHDKVTRRPPRPSKQPGWRSQNGLSAPCNITGCNSTTASDSPSRNMVRKSAIGESSTNSMQIPSADRTMSMSIFTGILFIILGILVTIFVVWRGRTYYGSETMGMSTFHSDL